VRVTEQTGSSGQHGKGPPDAVGSFLKEISLLQESKQDIGVILRVLHEATLSPNLLEEELVNVSVPNLSGVAKARKNSGDDDDAVRLAVYLYSIARACRDIVEEKRFNEFLRSARYTKENTEVLLAAFDKLTDAWSAYKPLLDLLDVAAWGENPSPDQIWTALKTPRRAYIDALGAYHMQILNVINILEATIKSSSM
jgi:hypothetical protein